jgi:hypothetical protein
LMTPTLSVADAETVVAAEIVAPAAGAVNDTTGAVLSSGAGCATLTEIDAVPTFPAASKARAVNVTGPFKLVVFQLKLYGADVNVPACVEPAQSSTLVTPTLSLALTATAVVPLTVLPAAGLVMDATGAVESVAPAKFTVVEAVPVFPAASNAFAVSVTAPLKPDVFQENEYGTTVRVPTRVDPAQSSTFVTATLSLAETLTFMVSVLPPRPPEADTAIDAVGGVVSPGAGAPPEAAFTALNAFTRPQP